jgi:hypothetical protein
MTRVTRIRLLWFSAAVVLAGGVWAGARFWLGGYIVRSVLGLAGASHVRFAEVTGTPWRLEVRDLEFDVKLQGFSARQVTLVRDRWWRASLGDVQVEQARVVLVLDGSDVNPWTWATYEQRGLGSETVQLPFRSIHVDGDLVVRMGTVPDQAIAFSLDGRPTGDESWAGRLDARGPGFRLAGAGALLRAGQELDFQVHEAGLDLAQWSRHIQRLVALPGAPWEMAGNLTGVGEGKVTARRFAATARFRVSGGRMRAGTHDVAAAGATADVEFSDLWKLRTKTGTLRIEQLRVGRIVMRDLRADFGLRDGKELTVQGGTFAALGGTVSVEPFQYGLDDRVVSVTLRPAGVSAAALLALTDGAVPRVGGRFDGVVPLHLRGSGVQLTTGGSLTLANAGSGELQVSASELVRSGADMDSATTEILKAVGNQNVVIRLDDFRLDVRPPGLPLGTSARVSVTGRVDGQPVAFSYHVNGGIERHLRILP